MKTLGSVLDDNRGVGPGFDFLRVALSLAILFTHSFLIAEGERRQFAGPILGVFHNSLVPMFFTLSGFLITGSALRLRLGDFLLNRAMRILPALAVDICVSALIIGPIFTTVSFAQYVNDYEFRAYFANIFGIIHFVLPGVFVDNPFPLTVNGSLWTVPYEIGCYAIMSALIISGLIKRPWWTLLAALILSSCVTLSAYTTFDAFIASTDKGIIFTTLYHFIGKLGLGLYIFFSLGAVAFLFRGFIPFSGKVAVASVVLLIGVAIVFPTADDVIRAPMIVYMTIFIGLSRLPKLPIYSNGDYSYGIYLYGYPLQQALVAWFPSLTSPWLHFAASVPIATFVAMGSWHFIEKPILGLRRKFSFTARKGRENIVLPNARTIVDEKAAGRAA